MTKPEPSEVALRGCASGRAALRLSAIEEVAEELLERRARRELRDLGSGMLAAADPDFTVCVVEMLTTDGSSFSARSAKLSGAGRAAAAGHRDDSRQSDDERAQQPRSATARQAEARRTGRHRDQLLAAKADGLFPNRSTPKPVKI